MDPAIQSAGLWGALAFAAVFAYDNRALVLGKLKGLIANVKPAPAEPVTDDHADLDALKRLHARAARSGCPKLQEAVRAVEIAFFNRGDAK